MDDLDGYKSNAIEFTKFQQFQQITSTWATGASTLAIEKLHQNNQFLHVLMVLLILVLATPCPPNSRLARMASLDKRVFFSQMLANSTPAATVMWKHFMIFNVVASWLTLTHFLVYSVSRQIHTVTVSVCFFSLCGVGVGICFVLEASGLLTYDINDYIVYLSLQVLLSDNVGCRWCEVLGCENEPHILWIFEETFSRVPHIEVYGL